MLVEEAATWSTSERTGTFTRGVAVEMERNRPVSKCWGRRMERHG